MLTNINRSRSHRSDIHQDILIIGSDSTTDAATDAYSQGEAFDDVQYAVKRDIKRHNSILRDCALLSMY